MSWGSPVRSTYAVVPFAFPLRTCPTCPGREFHKGLVDVVREVDPLPVRVVKRDVEVAREHELADDRVDRGVEFVHMRAAPASSAIRKSASWTFSAERRSPSSGSIIGLRSIPRRERAV